MKQEVEAKLTKEQEIELAWDAHSRIMNKQRDRDFNKALSQRAKVAKNKSLGYS